jgi:4-amino-4-deoxy-L-arabinose transferase-like glycosyltransferase
MSVPTIAARLTAPFERYVDSWNDPQRNGRAVLVFLLLFVGSWTLFHLVAAWSIDLQFDLLETYAWSLHPSAGYYKHPPLVAFAPMVWFSVFPSADWAFHLLALTNAAIALFAVDLIARRYLTNDKRLLVLILLLLTPFYQFHGQRISTNQLLLSTWPIATYFFLRAFETRGALWSAAAGAMAAVAMLGKYYSIYLVAALVIAALAHPARWTYLKSKSPWISMAAGLIVLAPHLHWLLTQGGGPFAYAYSVHGSVSTATLIGKAGSYMAGAIGYVVLPVIAYLLVTRPKPRDVIHALWPQDPNRRQLVVLLAAMILLPPVTAPLMGLQLSSLWTMSAWFLLPIVLLAPAEIQIPRSHLAAAAMTVTVVTVGALIAAPAVAWQRHVNGNKEGRAYYRLVSEDLTKEWSRLTPKPLRIVLSTFDLAVAVTFYGPSHPDSAPYFAVQTSPWITTDRMKQEGWAMLCPVADADCLAAIDRRRSSEPRSVRSEIEVTRYLLGRPSQPARFTALLIPPQ